jgi:hypothetical protein
LGTTKVTEAEVVESLRTMDADGNSTVEWDEFLEVAAVRVRDCGLSEAELERVMRDLLNDAAYEAGVAAEAASDSPPTHRDSSYPPSDFVDAPSASRAPNHDGGALLDAPTIYRPPAQGIALDDEEDEDDIVSESSGVASVTVTRTSGNSSSRSEH